ncbi:MAG TPA: nucleoside kinase [Anaerolineae bacterium]|nr:nucleoside kinase [Anaerolineae bacterium]
MWGVGRASSACRHSRGLDTALSLRSATLLHLPICRGHHDAGDFPICQAIPVSLTRHRAHLPLRRFRVYFPPLEAYKERRSIAVERHVWPADPRETAQARFPDGRIFEASMGTPVGAYIQLAYSDHPVPVIAALVDGELRELAYPLRRDAQVAPVFLSDSDGVRIYRRSLAFLMVTAISELYPEVQVVVDHSLPFGGYFCRVLGREPFSAEELTAIEARMRAIVDEDAPIAKEQVPIEEALAIFRQRGQDDKVRLLSRRRKDYLILYRLHSYRDYFHGYMLPSTGHLRYFALRPSPLGFVLQYPRRHWPTELRPYAEYPRLSTVFREYGDWLHLLGVEDVGSLNEAIENGRIREIVLVSEALHEERIADIAHDIATRREQIRLVLIAGPSASGKTTFSKRLSIQLLAHGVRPFPLALDDYFVDREKTPRDENGEYDFESLQALDLPFFNEQLLALMEGREVTLPRFDFQAGTRREGPTVQLDPDHVILVEGIHGLNPRLVSAIPRQWTFRVYVSALTQLNIDRHNRVPTTDTRLIRRIVRDATFRGYAAEETLNRWESVRRGEKRHIFPYQEHADVMFNSALVYELAVLKPLVEPLLLQIEPPSPRRVEAKRLLAFLEWFARCPPDLVPDNSILREFIGGSILRDYIPAGK